MTMMMMMMGSRGNNFVLLITMTFVLIELSECETRYFVKVPTTNSSDPLRKLMGIDNSRSINNDEQGGNGTMRIDRADVNNPEKSRSSFRINDDETMIRESLKANLERRNSFIESSTFDPDVLNKFLDDYANKIKSTTEKNYNFPFPIIGKPQLEKFNTNHKNVNQDVDSSTVEENKDFRLNKTAGENAVNSSLESTDLINQQDLNDTIKRNKYFGGNANDERNGGWVTLEAIPWSKSKISKWQASSSSQRPWPEAQVWEKPMSSAKPWNSEFPSRPAYINNEPWPEPSKIQQQQQRPDYQSSRPAPAPPRAPAPPASRPHASNRPSYFDDRFDHNLNQAEKWPPERPQSSWDKFPSADSYRPSMEIITDDRPSNFPTSWDKYTHSSYNNNHHKNKNNKYSYNERDRPTSNYDHDDHNINNNHHYQNHDEAEETSHDWRDSLNNYPSKLSHYKEKPSNFGRPSNDHQTNRPQHSSSHYQYTPDHPPSHPSNGEGQWVLLSTNHGYSKSRQRSMKFDKEKHEDSSIKTNNNAPARFTKDDDNDGSVAVMTSKRQVRLTVLPSVNGTNTTTSHGGLLEVEKTFQTVEQSRKEYEDSKLTALKPIIVNNRPIRNTLFGRPSNSAVLAAVGAGILPATMAVMIPMMLGRKKRESPPPLTTAFHNNLKSPSFYIPHPYHHHAQRLKQPLLRFF